jgi:hypothetical protein
MSIFRLTVATLLIASAINLSFMVPGGFVETRPPSLLWADKSTSAISLRK